MSATSNFGLVSLRVCPTAAPYNRAVKLRLARNSIILPLAATIWTLDAGKGLVVPSRFRILELNERVAVFGLGLSLLSQSSDGEQDAVKQGFWARRGYWGRDG